jgi:hypothetical protein
VEIFLGPKLRLASTLWAPKSPLRGLPTAGSLDFWLDLSLRKIKPPFSIYCIFGPRMDSSLA